MVSVTSRASRAFEELLYLHRAPADHGVRLVASAKGDLGMAIDAPTEADEVIPISPSTRLIIARRFATLLDGVEIDCFRSNFHGEWKTVFNIRPPAASEKAGERQAVSAS